MRNLAMAMAALTMAGCASEPAEEPAGQQESMTANGTVAGTYEVSGSDGTVSIVTLNADGTYSQITPEGTDAADGTFEVVDGKTCFKQHIIGAEPLCYTESARGEDGSYIATPDGGEPLNVTPVVAAEEMPAG